MIKVPRRIPRIYMYFDRNEYFDKSKKDGNFIYFFFV